MELLTCSSRRGVQLDSRLWGGQARFSSSFFTVPPLTNAFPVRKISYGLWGGRKQLPRQTPRRFRMSALNEDSSSARPKNWTPKADSPLHPGTNGVSDFQSDLIGDAESLERGGWNGHQSKQGVNGRSPEADHLTDPAPTPSPPHMLRAFLQHPLVKPLLGGCLLAAFLLVSQFFAKRLLTTHVLPAASKAVGKVLDRKVELGPVTDLNIFRGLALGRSAMGPSGTEFSCGEAAKVHVTLNLLSSILRRQVVLEALIEEPQVLVAQQPDFTWLGIPQPLDKKPEVVKSATPGKAEQILRSREEKKVEQEAIREARAVAMARKQLAKLMGSEMEESSKGPKKSRWQRKRKETVQEIRERVEAQSARGYLINRGLLTAEDNTDEEDESKQANEAAQELSAGQGEQSMVADRVDEDSIRVEEELVSRDHQSSQDKHEREEEPEVGYRALSEGDQQTERELDANLEYVQEQEQGADLLLTEAVLKGEYEIEETPFLLSNEVTGGREQRDVEKEEGQSASTQTESQDEQAPVLGGKVRQNAGEEEHALTEIAQSNGLESSERDGSTLQQEKSVAQATTSGLESDASRDSGKASVAQRSGSSTPRSEFGDDENLVPLKQQLIAAIERKLAAEKAEQALQDRLVKQSAIPKESIPERRGSGIEDMSDPFEERRASGLAASISPATDDSSSSRREVRKPKVAILYDRQKPQAAKEPETQNESKHVELDAKEAAVQELKEKEGKKELSESPKREQVKANGGETPEKAGKKKRPIAVLDRVVIKKGTLMLLPFGDKAVRRVEDVSTTVDLADDYNKVKVDVQGSLVKRPDCGEGPGGNIGVFVDVDSNAHKWNVRIKADQVHGPNLDHLLEIPIDINTGVATGDVYVWMNKEDSFPHLSGTVKARDVDFQIWDAPAAFHETELDLVLEDQRMFFHKATGSYGLINMTLSGDMDLNPVGGEYRFSAKIPGVEVNQLMLTLKARPPPFPIAGFLKGDFFCQGALDAPVFSGNVKASAADVSKAVELVDPPSFASTALRDTPGAVGAYDHVPFDSVVGSFNFDTATCTANIHGIKAVPVGGGEITAQGQLWVCPEGEVDPEAVDVKGEATGVQADSILQHYIPEGTQPPPVSIGRVNGEARFRGALSSPIINMDWTAPEASGSLDGAQGHLRISKEAIRVSGSAPTFDLAATVHTSSPPPVPTAEYWKLSKEERDRVEAESKPTIEGCEIDLRLKGFDLVGLADDQSTPPPPPSPENLHLRTTGRVKFTGKVAPQLPGQSRSVQELLGLSGEIALSNLKLNQLLIGQQLSGTLDMTPTGLQLITNGRQDEHLRLNATVKPGLDGASTSEAVDFSWRRGQTRTDLQFRPGISRLEVQHLPLDELELASLRGNVERVDLNLNFQRKKGQGYMLFKRPKFSGLKGEVLEGKLRWSGDVVTLEKLALEQANSHYDVQMEYVLPGEGARFAPDDTIVSAAAKLGNMKTGRWRVKLDVPEADLTEMLPATRILSQSKDPEIAYRSKEFFMEAVSRCGFVAESLTEQLQSLAVKGDNEDEPPDLSQADLSEEVPLPGLAELRGLWHGSVEASGGGSGETKAKFDLRGEDWEWGIYKMQDVVTTGGYTEEHGLRVDRFFIRLDTASLHADGTISDLGYMMGGLPRHMIHPPGESYPPSDKNNLHFALLNFPVGLVPPLIQAVKASSSLPENEQAAKPQWKLRGDLHMEGDLYGTLRKPQCEVKARLLDGAFGGVGLSKAELNASLAATQRLELSAVLEPSTPGGFVKVGGSVQLRPPPPLPPREANLPISESPPAAKPNPLRWEDEGLPFSAILEEKIEETGDLRIDAEVKDSGMMLLNAVSPQLEWIQGTANIVLAIRGTFSQPIANGMATISKGKMRSPVLPKPLSSISASMELKENKLVVDWLEGRVGRMGRLKVKGTLPLFATEAKSSVDALEVRTESFEVRAKSAYNGLLDAVVKLTGCLAEPEVAGSVRLSKGQALLSPEKNSQSPTSEDAPPSKSKASRTSVAAIEAPRNLPIVRGVPISTPDGLRNWPLEEEETVETGTKVPAPVRLKGFKILLGPDLRVMYPFFLNFGVSGELELSGPADPLHIKPKGTILFDNGDVNLVATQVKLNRDYQNKAVFVPEQGLDPNLDVRLVGSDLQLMIKGRSTNWQDNLVVTYVKGGEDAEALSPSATAKAFESQLAGALLEEDGQIAFANLAASTISTVMPKVEARFRTGQARWRLVSAPQIPNLLSLDPTTDPFKSLSNLNLGYEIEVQLGKKVRAHVQRQMKESEMMTQWTLLYQLSSRLRALFSSVPYVDNKVLLEYSASSQD